MNNISQDFIFFEKQLPSLLKEERGKYALIKNKEIQGLYPSVEDALKEGYKRFGNTEFLIQEITDEVRVNYINSSFTSNV